MNAPDRFTRAAPELALPGAHSMSPTQLRQVFDHACAGLVVQDERGRIVDCNSAAQRLLGLTREQMLGLQSVDPRWQAVDTQGRPLPGDEHPAMVTLREGRAFQAFVMGVRLPDGSQRWLSVDTTLLAREGSPPWVVASFVDVSAQRAGAAVQADQWRRLRASLEGSRTAVWEWNVQTGQAHGDERWAQLAGYRLEDVQPITIETWRKIVHPDDVAVCLAALKRHWSGETDHYDVEYRLRHRDGSLRWVRDRGRVTSTTPDGRAEWMFGTHDDITDRKLAELEAQRSRDMLEGLFQLSPLGISLFDLDSYRPVRANDALCRITGFSREEMLNGQAGERVPDGHREMRARWNRELREQGHFGPSESQILHKDGHVVHVAMCGAVAPSADGKRFTWSVMQDITERKAMERELVAAAQMDRLTGVANRTRLMQALEAMAERAKAEPAFGYALMFLDVDRFKLVNDTLGHEAGDELLCTVAARLMTAVPPHDGWLVARFGGDEFAVVAPGVLDAMDAQICGRRLLAALSLPYMVAGKEVHAGASLGVALAPEGGISAQTLLRDADTAMYEAKRSGRNGLMVYDDTMRARLTRGVTIDTALRRAVARGQMRVVYQPIVDLNTGAMTSVEALMRWTHPELGAVSPAEFIPIAEESGEIVALGQWILNESCQQWARWQKSNPDAAPASVSVNLSRVQMTLGLALLSSVRQALNAADMPASALQLEITEREVMTNPAQARELMLALRDMGVRLAMDDFGTGTSSLGCLRDYPFHAIKIDKSFVTDLCRDSHVLAVAHATVNVIENLGMASVAEGIEEPEELAALQAMGCRYGQGYLFARPLPADEVLAVMAAACAPPPAP